MKLDPELTKDWLDFEQFKERYMKVPVEEYPNKVLKAIPEPVVSVHIITYQHVDYIRDAIEGVLMQKTDFPFEIIIGDDESTDGTREICMEYADKYPNQIRLFLHKRENNISILGKPSHIFQYAFNSYNLRGKYVAVCSGDDYWTDPLKLQKQVQFMEENSNYSMTYHAVDIDFSDSKNKKLSESSTSFKPCTVLYRNIHERVPKQLLQVMNEDHFMNFMLSTIGESRLLNSISPSVYRKHDGSMWSEEDEFLKHTNNINTVEKLIQVFRNSPYKLRLQKQLIERLVKRERQFGKTYHSKIDFLKKIKSEHFFTLYIQYLIKNSWPYKMLKSVLKGN